MTVLVLTGSESLAGSFAEDLSIESLELGGIQAVTGEGAGIGISD
jgi:hypothetical protein